MSLSSEDLNTLLPVIFLDYSSLSRIKEENDKITEIISKYQSPILVSSMPKSASTFTSSVLLKLFSLTQVHFSYDPIDCDHDIFFLKF